MINILIRRINKHHMRFFLIVYEENKQNIILLTYNMKFLVDTFLDLINEHLLKFNNFKHNILN